MIDKVLIVCDEVPAGSLDRIIEQCTREDALEFHVLSPAPQSKSDFTLTGFDVYTPQSSSRLTTHHFLPYDMTDQKRSKVSLHNMVRAIESLHKKFAYAAMHGIYCYPAGFVTALCARNLHVPSIVACLGSDIEQDSMSPSHLAPILWTLDHADTLVFPSEYLRDRAVALSDCSGRSNVIYPEPARWDGVRSPAPYLVGTIGEVKRQKGTRLLIETIALLKEKYPAVRANIIGGIRQDMRVELAQVADRLAVSDRIHYLGNLPEDKKWQELAKFHVYVSPSVCETYGIAIDEAMSLGIPIVATDVGGVREHVPDASLVPSWDAPAMAHKISLAFDGKLESCQSRRTCLQGSQVPMTYGTLYARLINTHRGADQ